MPGATSDRPGSTRHYRRIRAAVLEANRLENGGRCTLAIPYVCTGTADTLHHTLGWAVTGDDPRYMEATCAACNGVVGEPGAKTVQPPPWP
jgi:hypothetical protein